MNRSISSKVAAALLAIASVGAAAAHAATSVHISVGTPAPVYGAAPVYVQPQAVHAAPWRDAYQRHRFEYVRPGYDHDWRQGRERGWRSACRAPGWDPHVRYMPGNTVWRNGTLYMATRLSASVWNVNSPPEWTPNYWVPARCA